jgi:hypothetical protein
LYVRVYVRDAPGEKEWDRVFTLRVSVLVKVWSSESVRRVGERTRVVVLVRCVTLNVRVSTKVTVSEAEGECLEKVSEKV